MNSPGESFRVIFFPSKESIFPGETRFLVEDLTEDMKGSAGFF